MIWLMQGCEVGHRAISPVWVILDTQPSHESAFSRTQSMKGLGRVVVSSAFGGLVGAAAFFAVDGLIPEAANAQSHNPMGNGYVQDHNPMGSGYVQDKGVLGF